MIHKGGAGVRNRGNNYERQLAQEFRELGWHDCVTARAESRNTDSKKIDLCNTIPFSVQAKCKNKFGNPTHVLMEMPQDSNYNIVFTKVVSVGEFITMNKNDFYELLKMLKKENII
jgi:hypothetical protein